MRRTEELGKNSHEATSGQRSDTKTNQNIQNMGKTECRRNMLHRGGRKRNNRGNTHTPTHKNAQTRTHTHTHTQVYLV